MDYPLTPEMLISALEKDGELAFQSAMDTLHHWRSADGRGALRSLAWEVNDKEAFSHLDASNQFNSYAERMKREHPEWLKVELGADHMEEIDPDDRPATAGDLSKLHALLTTENADKVAERDKRSKWTLWITVFIALYVFIKLH